MMKCVYCGTELEENAKFCTKCGKKVGEIPKAEQLSAEGKVQTPQGAVSQKPGIGIIIALVVLVVLLLSVIVLLCMKVFVEDTLDEQEDTQMVTEQEISETEEEIVVTTEVAKEVTTEEEASIFEEIPLNYTFSSGAGAWDTSIEIKPDGTFEGSYHDTNAGESGSGYESTVYYCDFKGRFSKPEKVDDYTYSTNVEELEITNDAEESIEDQVRYIPSDPYGFDDAGEFMIYLPGSDVDSLPEAFVQWTVYTVTGEPEAETLSFCGLYNVNAGFGFFSDLVYEETEDSDYIISYSDSQLLTEVDVEGLSVQQINYAKNEIYARHGYIFESNELQEYFGGKSWYDPQYKKAEFDKLGLLSDTENKNAAFLSKMEKEMGGPYQLDQ